ncbi:lipase secretion chaperone [Enterovibrio baiacu]|uniref:lipase secretion chaperone n=1 Tax=Enterovibrio baiacu TaxID=2491023 RepID=UPI003D11454F
MYIASRSLRMAFVGILLVTAAIYLTGNAQEEKATDTPAPSQIGTDIDISSDRDTFEYFLSTLGEKELGEVQAAYNEFAGTVSYGEQQATLFEKYLTYRESIASVQSPDGLSGIEYLKFIHEKMQQLQASAFSTQEQSKLFYEDNLAREMTIKKAELKALGVDDQTFHDLWQDTLNTLPPDMKESYQNAELLGNINSLASLNEDEKSYRLTALVGEEAASRIQVLEQEERAFHASVQTYLQARETLLNDNSYSDAERLQAITDLRSSHFSSDNHRRVQGLESLDDTEKNRAL